MIGKNQEPDIGKDTQFKPGVSGNPAGKPKGSLHLSTMIQELGESIDWDKTQLKSKDELKKQYGKNGLKALTYVAFSMGMSGNVKAMEWLAKHGYGTKLVIQGEDPVQELLKKFELKGDDSAGKTEELKKTTP